MKLWFDNRKNLSFLSFYRLFNMGMLTGVFLLLSILSCKSNDSREMNDKETGAYEHGKTSLEQIEKKKPLEFLSVKGSDKKTLVGQTVVKGTIFNKGKITTYKDIELKISFFSRTGALLEEDRETIFESINPGD